MTDEATKLSSEGQELLQLVEDSPKPLVAAIMGSCLGGGLEVHPFCCSNNNNDNSLFYCTTLRD